MYREMVIKLLDTLSNNPDDRKTLNKLSFDDLMNLIDLLEREMINQLDDYIYYRFFDAFNKYVVRFIKKEGE